MKFRTTIAIALTCFSLPVLASEPLRQPGNLLAGNDHAAWLVRPSAAGLFCDIFVRPLGGTWRAELRNQTGQPIVTVAVGETLHLLYADRQHVILDKTGQPFVAGNLPGLLIDACGGKGMGDTKQPTVFALVRQTTPPTTNTQPATQTAAPTPKTAPATKTPSQKSKTKLKRTPPQYECLYHAVGNEWKFVASRLIPASLPQLPSPRFLAMADGTLYWLGRRENGPRPRPFVLRRYTPDAQAATWTDAHTFPASQTPLGITSRNHRLFVVLQQDKPRPKGVTTAPAETSLTLLRYDPKASAPEPALPITQNAAPKAWPADAQIEVAHLGTQLALLWSEKDETHFALCRQTGAMEPVENVTQLLQETPDRESANQWYNYFLLAVMIVVGMGMFFRRLRTPPRPFVLAEGLVPGNLFKRLLAAIIDFLPFYLLAAALFMPANLNMDDLQQYLQNPRSAPANLLTATLYTLMLSQALFVVYGTIMEMRFGATLGKRLLRLRTVRDDGSRPDLRGASLRNTTKIVELSMLMSPLAWLMMILVLLPLLTRNRQRLGDMIARTTVVEARSLTQKSPAPPTDSQEPPAPPPSDSNG